MFFFHSYSLSSSHHYATFTSAQTIRQYILKHHRDPVSICSLEKHSSLLNSISPLLNMHPKHFLLCFLAPFTMALPKPKAQEVSESFYYAYQVVPAFNSSNTRAVGYFLNIGKKDTDVVMLISNQSLASVGHIVDKDRIAVSGARRGNLWFDIPDSNTEGSKQRPTMTAKGPLEIFGCNGNSPHP